MSFRYSSGIRKPGYNPVGTPPFYYTYNLLTWGVNNKGQLGLDSSGNYAKRSSPTQVGDLTDWTVVSAGPEVAFAIKTDGTLWSWGANGYGTQGRGNSVQYSSPKQVGILTNWLNVSAGTYSALAVKTDGTLWAWGRSESGQLGLGNTTTYSYPTQVGGLTNWASVMTKNGNTPYVVAVKTDGTLWAWGYNANGQLGDGTSINRSSPVQIGALTTWTDKIALCNETTGVIKTDGTLWVWGRGYNGNLGTGGAGGYLSSPVQLGALSTWTAIAGTYRNFAAVAGGRLYTWGANNNGQLGLGDTANRSSPTQVGSLTNWSQLSEASGDGIVHAIKTDGTLWAWGINTSGVLGLGDIINRSSPVQVGSLTTWYRVSNGGGFTMALLY